MRRNDGFTLTELVIAVAIIGMLAAMAIPNFMRYQARARRGEAYANLASIARAERSYYAEKGIYYEALTQPNPGGSGVNLGADTHGWDAAATAEYAALGWEPEGRVRYAYDINTGATSCSCDDTCFTATGYGDVDNDDILSAVMYVSPGKDASGNLIECPSHLFSFGTPLKRNSTQKIYNEVAVNWASDEY
jgi:type IV pilus assembly protein PilA